MKLKIECEIELNDNWVTNEEELKWMIEVLNDKENAMLVLWSNDIGDEIGQTNDFKYEIL